MNSDSCSEEEKDKYPVDPEKLKPIKKLNSIYPTSSHHKTDLSILLQIIPLQSFFPYCRFLQTGTCVYSNKKIEQELQKNQTVYFCIHGAGQSALTFGQLAKQMRDNSILLSYDLMCHGNSQYRIAENQLTIGKLCQQAESVLNFIINKLKFMKIVLIGHSLGGSIATRLANNMNKEKKQKLAGLVMIDTIEGLARSEVISMQSFLRERPQTFQSLESAIKWNYKAGCVRRLESARYSVPSFFKKLENKFLWRTNLLETITLWDGWFKGISEMFININCQKILMTATKFRLDQILLKGFEENRFFLELFDYSGHNIQEDQYQKVNRILQFHFYK